MELFKVIRKRSEAFKAAGQPGEKEREGRKAEAGNEGKQETGRSRNRQKQKQEESRKRTEIESEQKQKANESRKRGK